jgi:pyruvate,water dikinase
VSEIVWLGDQDCHDAERVGAKAANISQIASEFNVPRGFALSVEAFSRWCEPGRLKQTGKTDIANVPDDFKEYVANAYRQLAESVGEETPAVAVRSSATDEDSGGASFAGQHDTYLNITGAAAVSVAIVKCWNSLQNAEAIAYRKSAGISLDGARMAVLVQHLVASDTSGVVFSANPITGTRDEVMINMSWGLGESVVSGMVTPDTFIVSKGDFKITSENIAEKMIMTVSTPDGTKEVDVPRIMRSAPSASPEQVIEAARMAVSLEVRLGWPVDAEFVFQGAVLFLLQARPITTL